MFLSYRTQNWVVDDDISNNWSVPPFVLFSANGSRVLRRKKTIRLREKTNEESFRGPCASNLLHLLCNTERRWSKQLVLSCVKLPSLLEAAARSWDPATYKGNICLDTSVPYAHFFGFMPHRGGVGWSGVESDLAGVLTHSKNPIGVVRGSKMKDVFFRAKVLPSIGRKRS